MQYSVETQGIVQEKGIIFRPLQLSRNEVKNFLKV